VQQKYKQTRVGLKNIFCTPYVEAMCQIWWRSVHKSHHNLGDRRRTSETGDRTRQMILYSVQCCYALHWTDKWIMQLIPIIMVLVALFIIPFSLFLLRTSCTISNSGAVEDFILPYSAVYLRIKKWLLKSVHICQSYRKNISGAFFMAHGVVWNRKKFADAI